MNATFQALLGSIFKYWMVAVWITLAVSMLRRDADAKRQDFFTALGLIAYSAFGYIHLALIRFLPHTIDAKLWSLDEHLRMRPLFLFDFLRFHNMTHTWFFLVAAYGWLPIMIATAWVAEQNYAMRRALVLGGVFCWFSYTALPAAGPIYYVKGLAVFSARNCMPSMHLSWSLMLAVNARNRWLRVLLWGYVGVMTCATLGLGEHYFVDLIAAVPYTFGVQWLATRGSWARKTQIPNLAIEDERVPALVP